MSSSRRAPRSSRAVEALRLARNVEALRCLEADIINTQLRRGSRLASINRLSSDVHLADLAVRRFDFFGKCESAIARERAEDAARVRDAATRFQQQLDEQRAILQEAIAAAASAEARAKALAAQEREYYEREAEFRIFTESEGLRAEYEQLHNEVSQLKREHAQSRRNREEIEALKADIGPKRPRPAVSKPRPRLPVDERKQRLRE